MKDLSPPLIVTLQLDKESQDFFNQQRRKHFPESINYIDAHITLFHRLPSGNAEVNATLEKAAARDPFEIAVTGVAHTGNGVAYLLEVPEIRKLHSFLQSVFDQWLIPQDRSTIRPHITVQNKVGAEVSKRLSESLKEDFHSFSVVATGINTWLYKGGPWEQVKYYAFNGSGS